MLAHGSREDRRREATDAEASLAGRAYRAADLPVLRTLGVGSGLLAVGIMTLYVTNPEALRLYDADRVSWLWGVCGVLLYWVGRLWLLAERGRLGVDPIAFALRDRWSWAALVAAVFFLLAAA